MGGEEGDSCDEGSHTSSGHGGWLWGEKCFLLVAPGNLSLLSLLALMGQGPPYLSLIRSLMSAAVTVTQRILPLSGLLRA